MNIIKQFSNPEFGTIRTMTDKNGEPWFVGRDVATALGYANPANAVAVHVDKEDKTSYLIQVSGSTYKTQNMIINESGLYSLILSSKLDSAKKFKRWVTSEVLPAIRKTGGYIPTKDADGNVMSDEMIMARALQITRQTIEEQQKVIAEQHQALVEQAPKVLFHDCVATSDDTCSIAEMAKMIAENGYPMGQKRLFEWLRNHGYLCVRKGSFYNTPYQEWVEKGIFRVEINTHFDDKGYEYAKYVTRVTGKGQAYFINIFINMK